MTNLYLFRNFPSLLVFSMFLSTVYLFYLGILDISYTPQLLVVLFSVSLCIYSTFYHSFEKDRHKHFFQGVTFVVFSVSALYTVYTLSQNTFPKKSLMDLQSPGTISLSNPFLPKSWVLLFLTPPLLFSLLHVFMTNSRPSYTTPQTMEEIPTSPMFFSFACMIIGFWSVLFVGINITQRVIIIAPIFEELLKFGVALFIATALFGRSTNSRIAVAIVIGTLFGLIEHQTTYASEPDLLYLFRTAFHLTTTVLSVSIYTLFERKGLDELLLTSLVTSMLLHYFNNMFSLFGALIVYFLAESSQNLITIIFGASIIVLGNTLILLTLVRENTMITIHRSVYEII